jgi:hypothetical protein
MLSFLDKNKNNSNQKLKNGNNNMNAVDGSDGSDGNIDVSISFDNVRQGAIHLVHECIRQADDDLKQSNNDNNDDDDDDEIRAMKQTMEKDSIDYFTRIFAFYQNSIIRNTNIIDYENNDNDPKIRYKARIVSSIGTSGGKCPRWHIDHVPIRLVMSLKGPGCVYIPHELEYKFCINNNNNNGNNNHGKEGVLFNRKALNGMDIDDTIIANEMIMPMKETSEKLLTVAAKANEAVLLMGRCWEEKKKQESCCCNSGNDNTDDDTCESSISSSDCNTLLPKAVPHRSPLLGENEKRILLTIDIEPKLRVVE